MVKDTRKSAVTALRGSENIRLMLGDGMTGRIIKNAQSKISELNQLLEGLRPKFEEKRTFFEDVQRDFLEIKRSVDSIEHEITEQNNLIDTFSRYKGSRQDKVLMVNNPESQKPKKASIKTGINWMDEAALVLNELQKPLNPEDLFWEIYNKPHIKEAASKSPSSKYISNIKNPFINSVVLHATKVTEKTYKGNMFKPRLALLENGLIGLPQWLETPPVIGEIMERIHEKLAV
jgi:hypothetical protein